MRTVFLEPQTVDNDFQTKTNKQPWISDELPKVKKEPDEYRQIVDEMAGRD